MKPLLIPAQMYDLEAQHFQAGMPTLTAMENAASAFVDELISFYGTVNGQSVHIACGSGNNGGDGYAIARLLACQGAQVTLIALTPLTQLRGDALINAQRAITEMNLPCISVDEWVNHVSQLSRPHIWIDALFGIGLNRPLPENCLRLIERMSHDRARGSLVASVDVPSGLNAESGEIFLANNTFPNSVVHADLTVTFQYPKSGHYLLDGMDCVGVLKVRDIGMNSFPPEHTLHLIEPADLRSAFPHRKHNSHKGTYGHLLIIAGSLGMVGAAAYAAHAALRTGAGLVSIACPQSIVPILQTLLPAAMCIPLPEQNGAISAEACPILKNALCGKNAVVIGPGLSLHASPLAVQVALECGLPTVIDADALNLMARYTELQALLQPHHVLTPHPGEARRLCADCTGHALEDILLLRTLNATVLLKGAATVICGEQTYLSASGSAGMATGGSGDVLAGILGAMLAQGIPAERAAWCASELHGRCGELAEHRLNAVCMTASDLIEELPHAIGEIYAFPAHPYINR